METVPIFLIAEILRLSRRMRLEAGRGPSAAELAGYLHLPLAEVRDALARAKDLAAAELAGEGAAGGAAVPGGLIEAMTVEEERALCRRFGIGDADGGPAVRPLDAATQGKLRKTTKRVLASLTPREQRVLKMRFGIGMNTNHTLEDARGQFEVTRERIHRIQAKMLSRLKPEGSEET
jgi:RNA polymerase primary sigma factor